LVLFVFLGSVIIMADVKLSEGKNNVGIGLCYSIYQQIKQYIENLSHNISRMIMMGISLVIGISVPDNYNARPFSVVIVGVLISSLLYFWHKVLGSPVELDSETYSVMEGDYSAALLSIIEQQSNSSSCAHNITFTAATLDSLHPCSHRPANKFSSFIYTAPDSNKICVRGIDRLDTTCEDLHRGQVTCIISANNSSIIVSGDDTGSICIWDSETMGTIRKISGGHTRKILSLTLRRYYIEDEEGMYTGLSKLVLLSCCLEGKVRIWDMESGANLENICHIDKYKLTVWPPETVSRLTSGVASICSNNVLRVVYGTSTASMCLWTSQMLRGSVYVGHYGQITTVAIVDEIKCPVIMTASADWTVRIWEGDTGLYFRLYVLVGHLIMTFICVF
jgi:WD40 repeat protein